VAKRTIVYNNAHVDIAYEILNPSMKEDIVFLHGWGANRALMRQVFQNTFSQYRHIYIDLPGFGHSPSTIHAMDSLDYVNILEAFFELASVSKQIIIGHSFGGKLALLLEPKFLVLIAASGITVPKPLPVRLKIALFKVLKPLHLQWLREAFRADDAKQLSEVMYETFKRVVNEDFSEAFVQRKNPALLLWGDEDTATPLSSAKKMKALMPKAQLHVFKGDHYFFLEQAKACEGEVLAFLQSERL